MATRNLLPLFGIIFLGLFSRQEVFAAPGRVGCFYDLQLCEPTELCYNDSLFGTCVNQLSDAVNYSDLEPEALAEAAQVLQYLIESGHKWQDSYTQCVVGKYLQSAVTHQRYDPEVCEYLKALLAVIDQNKGRLDQAPPSATIPAETGLDITPVQISNNAGQPSHGEFMSQSDMATDFDEPQPLPLEPMMPVPINAEDSNTYNAVQKYVRAYQQALAQQQPPMDDLVTAQKKSDPAVVITNPEAASTMTPPTLIDPKPVPAASLLAELNSTADEADNAEAMRALVSLVSSYPGYPISDDQGSSGPQPETPVLFATAPDPVPEDQQMTIGIPFSGQRFDSQMMLQQGPPQNFPLQGGFEDIYVPDFSAIPPPEILQDMFMRRARAELQSSPQITPSDLLLAQQLFGPPPMGSANQNGLGMIDPRVLMDPLMSQQLDPRMFMDPRAQFDPRGMGIDPRMFGAQFDPRMNFDSRIQLDPRMMVDPTMQMMSQQGMNPRDLFGSGFGMSPNMMSSPPFLVERRSDPFMGRPEPFMGRPEPFMGRPEPFMGRPEPFMGRPDPFMGRSDPFMGRSDPFMDMGPMKRGGPDFMSLPPPGFGGMPYMQNGPMMDPRMQAMYAPPSPYGFFPQGVALPFTQQESWRPPMLLPDGFVFAEQGFPVIEAAVNESADANRQMIGELLGETEEQSANGASGPTSPNKKDQEYRSLLPSDESQDHVSEDVTVTVVKGNAEKPIPSGDGTAVGNADDETNVQDDDYVFLITEPQLNLEQGRFFLAWLAAVLNMPSQTFYDLNVNGELMTFRVNPAVDKLNATYVAQTLGGDELRNGLQRTNNLAVLRAGVGRYALDDSAGLDVPELRFQQTAIVQSESAAAAEAEIAKKYDVVDPTFAFLVTEPALTYDKARRMLNWLALKLHVPQTIFSSLHIEDHQLLFRVSPYFSQINASGVVDQLSDAGIQAALRQEFQVEIIRSGIGDRVQIIKADNKQRQTLLIGLIAVACVATILISLGIIYLVRRNLLMRKKIHGLGGDVESSKEYEELCRQRMACKNLESSITASPDHKNGHDRTAHSSTSSWSEEPAPTNMDITTGHMVLSYMEDHLKHKERMNEEWASLCTYEADPSSTETGCMVENVGKNRSANVVPYDHTRVHLKPEANSTKSDYVNANFITDADPKNAVYIATQGPLPDTVSDFWQMVWENNSTIIVMLTKLRENDLDLCHIYWPKEGSECYNIFEVHLVSEHIWCDDYLVRNFYLKNLQTHETRTVTQFHYLNWPSMGVPSSLKTFLEFRRKINKCYKGGSSPIVIHCSDGVDRTGAYCLIDLVLNRMAKGVKEIDIAATLEHLRDQRIDMVRTREQFEFVLTAVAQEIQAILKSMPQK